MRRVVVLIVLCACAVDPATGTVTQLTIGTPSGTPSFPNTTVGQTSAPQSYDIYETVHTIGIHTDTIESIAYSCPDFTVSWAPGDTGDDCETTGCFTGVCPLPVTCTYDPIYSFSATFHPTVAASVSCVLTITGSANTVTYTLTGTGTAPPINVSASPASVAFGGVRVGTDSTAVAVTVSNSGAAAATVSSVGVSSGYAILSGPTGSYSLGAGATQPYQVVCHPAAVGQHPGTMTITSNDPNNPTISIPLTCNGINSSLLLSPSPAVLPTTRVGEPVQQTITITNMGGAAATIQDVTITGVDTVSAPAPNTVLAASASVQAVVSFPATAPGMVSGNMHVDYDSGMSVDASIAAQALATSMSLTPDGAVDLGPICVGQSNTQMFRVIANQAGAFKITALSQPAAPFSLAAPALPASVQGNAGNMVTFSVTAMPTDAGDLSSTVMVTTDIPNGQPDIIALTATGLPAGVGGTPAMVDFGPAPVATTTLGQPVSITNCGTSPITVNTAMITGTDAASFAIVQQPPSMQIDPASTATWLVVMSSQTSGTKEATFEADYAGGSATVALTGQPFTPGGDGSGSSSTVAEKSSYYACNTGRPVALAPVALALLAVRRRRRR